MMFFHHENPHEATNGFVKAITLQIFSKFSNVKFSLHCAMFRKDANCDLVVCVVGKSMFPVIFSWKRGTLLMIVAARTGFFLSV